MGSRREVDWSSQMNWVCACYHDDDDDGRTAGRCWPEEESHDYRQRGRWWCDIDAAVCGDGQGFRAADDRGMECIIIIKSKGRSCNLKVNRISLLYTRASSSTAPSGGFLLLLLVCRSSRTAYHVFSHAIKPVPQFMRRERISQNERRERGF